jgi:hypothetical protein
MDLASAMFDHLKTDEEIFEFSSQLAVHCPEIEEIYVSTLSCFKIIHKYCSTLKEDGHHGLKVRKIHAVIDSEEKKQLLQEIEKICPSLMETSVIELDFNVKTQPQEISDNEVDTYCHDECDFTSYDDGWENDVMLRLTTYEDKSCQEKSHEVS